MRTPKEQKFQTQFKVLGIKDRFVLWESLLEVIRQNIAGWCRQNFCFQKFVDNPWQCFAFTPEANFPAHYLNFHWRVMRKNLAYLLKSSLLYCRLGEFKIMMFEPNLYYLASILGKIESGLQPHLCCLDISPIRLLFSPWKLCKGSLRLQS